ncbi:predicted protein [Chaetomium globosum CBS 148.51]|uniref:Uncharacterized protein n=1 Tax=Chaetomium globosum (strain ATCC 6205 / CBS 148.51 / DSM 1962 / NBRC 6347 / NRRL 1970) TaxID=306901 RepID=Q2GWN6_CHAGB|nr:uncharacterized protein CHGG_07618 [Chaetomium globosum CBS 148.51]EAQ86365.1 predicted protein [Chaetomium globosum CBS 148.51]
MNLFSTPFLRPRALKNLLSPVYRWSGSLPLSPTPPGVPDGLGALRPSSPTVPNCSSSISGSQQEQLLIAGAGAPCGPPPPPATYATFAEADEGIKAHALSNGYSLSVKEIWPRAADATPVANVNDEAGTTIAPRLSRQWMQDNDETYDDALWDDDGYKNGVISHTFEGRLDDLYGQEEQGEMEESQALSCIEVAGRGGFT